MLSGCSWLKIDNYKYYNQVVVTVDGHNFYKRDLIEAFNNYGYQYYESYGYSLEESVNYTIGSMIDRWLLLQDIKSNTSYNISNPEKLQIKAEVFAYMEDSLNTFVNQVREEWDIVVPTEEAEKESASLRTKEEEYTPTTYYNVVLDREEIVGGETTPYYKAVVTRNEEFNVVLEKTTTETVGSQEKTIKYYKVVEVIPAEDEIVVDNTITLDTHFNKEMVRKHTSDTKVFDEAWTRYVKSLQDQAENEGRSSKESEVLLHEEQRLEETMTNNLYLEKYEHDYLSNLPVDYEAVLTYYRSQYKAQKETYDANESLYHTAMQQSSTNYIYYHPNSGNEYVNTKHILMKFNDAQTEAIKALNTEFGVKNDYSDADEKRKENAEYQARLNKIIGQTTCTFEMDGETKTWNAVISSNDEYSVYEYVRDNVTGSTLAERCAQFDDLMYIFNDDTGNMNSEFDYVVNLDTDVADQMVKPFANGVRALDKSNGGEGEGSMSYIVSEYGIHIIFHAGNAKNLINENNINNVNDKDLLRILCTNYTTPESNKTIFNYIYDQLKLDENSYNIKSQGDINTIRTELAQKGIVIKYYEDNYKDLFE